MADRSAIEWTDATWNPVRARRVIGGVARIGWHCEHVSEGCRNCYAERFNRRGLGTGLDYKPGHLRTAQRPQGEVEVYLDEKMLRQPMNWLRPRLIFVGSMTDIAADFVSDEMLDRIFASMALSPQHIFQLLTKRIERLRRWFEDDAARKRGIRTAYDAMGYSEVWLPEWPLPNVWLGTSIEDRAALLERAGHLRKTPAAVRFFSCEPLLGDLGQVVLDDPATPLGTGIDWVICGGESGPGARPMHPDWARSLRDQCAAAGVPFFFKQWGEWAPDDGEGGLGKLNRVIGSMAMDWRDGRWQLLPCRIDARPIDGDHVYKLGKKQSGRLLDGVLHDAMPQVPA